MDYIFSFLPHKRQQDIATAREATGDNAAKSYLNVYQYRIQAHEARQNIRWMLPR